MSVNYATLAAVQYEQFHETNPVALVIDIDGTRYRGISAQWTENAHGATDAATIVVPLSTNPDFTVALFRGDYTVKTDSQGNQTLVSPGTPGAKVVVIYPNGTTGLVPQGKPIPAGAKVVSNNSPVYVKIYAGFPKNQSLGPTDISQIALQFYGIVDLYSGVFHEDTVTFTARSLASQLVDNRLANISTNQTMRDFIQQQSVRYNLPTPIVSYAKGSIPATIQEILAYDYIGGSSFTASLYGMHPMDLLIRGSLVDDADVWVDIVTGAIHYEQPSLVSRNVVDLKYGRDWIGLEASHAPNFSKAIQVQVHTHQPRTKNSTTVRFEADGFGGVTTKTSNKYTTSDAILGTNFTVGNTSSTSATGVTTNSTTTSSVNGGNFSASIGQGAAESAKQKYPLFVGNVSPERATAMAQSYLRQISQHEFAVKGEIPITNRLLSTLSITSLLRIHGMPWSLANTTGINGDAYYPRAIEHTVSVEDGWKATINALNHSLAAGGV